MLNGVEWGEYRLGDLFDINNTLSFNTDKLVDGDEYDYVTRTSTNQGILKSTGFVNKENINEAGVWSLGLLQMDFFYRKKKWYAGQFVRKIVPKIELAPSVIPFFTAVLNHQKPILLSVLVRNVDDIFKNLKVKLPVKEGKLDFDFMESFIAELEAERIGELSDYLKISGFNNYELSPQELKALESIKTISWDEYRIGDLFDKLKTKKLPEKVDNYFVDAVAALLEGFEPVSISAEEFIDKLDALGPCDIDTFKNKINDMLKAYTKGKDAEKLRIVVKR